MKALDCMFFQCQISKYFELEGLEMTQKANTQIKISKLSTMDLQDPIRLSTLLAKGPPESSSFILILSGQKFKQLQ